MIRPFIISMLFCGCAILTRSQDSAPNDIPVPWYSQKIGGCPYAHCTLASALMVFDYYKGMTASNQRSPQEAEKKLIEYQKNYFLKKGPPFRKRTNIAQGGYYVFEIDSLARHYESMIGAAYYEQKDYDKLREYIDKGIPVMINVRYRGSKSGLIPGDHGHWIVLRGITNKHVWINDPGRSTQMRSQGENRKYPIHKETGNPSWFDGCWTGRYMIVTPSVDARASTIKARKPKDADEKKEMSRFETPRYQFKPIGLTE